MIFKTILGEFNIQYHRMPKYLRGGRRTTAFSYIRVLRNHKFLLDVRMPKYGVDS